MAAGAVNATHGQQVPVDRAADLKLKAGAAVVATAAGAALANKKAAAVAHDVQPRVASALAAIAAGAAAAKESAVEAAERAPDAFAVLKGDAVAHKGGKGKWIVLFGTLTAGAALMAWRKSSRRPQPCATARSDTRGKPGTDSVGRGAATTRRAARPEDATVEKTGEPTGAVGGAAEHRSTVNGTVATATDTTVPAESSAAGDPLGVPDPVILSDGEIDDLAFDDPAAAADADGDAMPPSTSKTTEVADLSTPHLDSGPPSTQGGTEQS